MQCSERNMVAMQQLCSVYIMCCALDFEYPVDVCIEKKKKAAPSFDCGIVTMQTVWYSGRDTKTSILWARTSGMTAVARVVHAMGHHQSRT